MYSHELAALARSQGDRLVIADVPDALRQLVVNDCNLSPS